MKTVNRMKPVLKACTLIIFLFFNTLLVNGQVWNGTTVPTNTNDHVNILNSAFINSGNPWGSLLAAPNPTLYLFTGTEESNNNVSLLIQNERVTTTSNMEDIVSIEGVSGGGPAIRDLYFRITGDGKTLVNVDPTSNLSSGFSLYVGQGILTEKVVVMVQSSWPDYVFNDDYQLPSLHQLSTYIKQNKHLPDVPSAAEVANDGISLGDMDAKLLRKIEELTLYMIALKKENEDLRNRVEQLEK